MAWGREADAVELLAQSDRSWTLMVRWNERFMIWYALWAEWGAKREGARGAERGQAGIGSATRLGGSRAARPESTRRPGHSTGARPISRCQTMPAQCALPRQEERLPTPPFESVSRTHRPCARGMKRLLVGPSSAKVSATYSLDFNAPALFLALAAA